MKMEIEAGNIPGIEKCIAGGVDVNADLGGGTRPLMIAARNERTAVAAYLIRKGARVNDGDDTGFTPLHDAAGAGDVGMVRLLIARGADVKRKNRLDENALSLAAVGSGEGFLATARLLIEHRIPLDQRRAQGGATPLISAATNGNRELVKLLLDKGADPSIRNAEGKTAMQLLRDMNNTAFLAGYQRLLDGHLIEAILNSDTARVDSLLEGGADPNAKTGIMTEWVSLTNLSHIPGRNLSVLQFAYEQKNDAIIERLRAAGARE
jgi:ankyrin repeat protein